MPELPEVECIRRGLSCVLPGKRIHRVQLLLPRQVKRLPPERFVKRLEGAVFCRIDRRGKYLLLHLDRDICLIVHLGMTGRLVFEQEGILHDAQPRCLFQLEGGSLLVFGDTRTFGRLYLLPEGRENDIPGLRALGPEPLQAAFSCSYFHDMVRHGHQKIKGLLLDQTKIAGLGNIYTDEALFLAGIYPARKSADLSDREIVRLYQAIRQVLEDGIRDGGTTFRDYKNAEGKKGSHQEHLFVYDRENQPCRRCGALIAYTKIAGRGTRYCPVCQPMAGR